MWPEAPSTDVAADRTAVSGRDPSLDVAKGVAITAIVVSHVLRGLAAPDTVPRLSAAFLEADDALYSWHVALFAVIAGALLPPGVDRRGRLEYLRPRAILFTYLYVVWTVIQAGHRQVENGLRGDPIDTAGFLQSFLTAYGQLWWLAFMVLAMALAVIVCPWRGRGRALISLALVSSFSVAVWGWTGPWVFEEGLALLAFFWIGVLAGRDGLSRITASGAAPWVCALGLTVGAAILAAGDPMPPTSWLGTRTTVGVALGVVTSVALCAGVLALSGMLSRTRAVRALSVLGERSLDIFLAHILAITAVRAALQGLGIDNVATHLVVGTTVGLTLPLAIWWLGRCLGFPWLFTSPVR